MSAHTPARFRKRPVVIEAVQWTGENVGAIVEFTSRVAHVRRKQLFIETLEGRMETSPGDWIIRGVKGEFYPCKPDIFDATYEAVEPWDE